MSKCQFNLIFRDLKQLQKNINLQLQEMLISYLLSQFAVEKSMMMGIYYYIIITIAENELLAASGTTHALCILAAT